MKQGSTKTRYSIQEARVSFTVVIIEHPFKGRSTTYTRRKVYGFKSVREAQAYIDKQTAKDL